MAHQTIAAEIYFVINRTNKHAVSDFTFRVAGKQPEIWDAVTGKTRLASAYHQSGGGTTLSLELDAFSSYFIVFRKPVAIDVDVDSQGKAAGNLNFPPLVEISELHGPWNTRFDTKWGACESGVSGADQLDPTA